MLNISAIQQMNDVVLRACEQALKCNDMLHKHGAVIWDFNGIIATGYNKGCTHDKLKSMGFEHSIHAEADAIMKSKKVRRKISFPKYLLVVRFKNNKIMNSKPCKKCMEMLMKSNITWLVYSDKNGHFISEIVK